MRRSTVVAVLFALMIPVGLLAQEPGANPQAREGFWISFGVGGGPKWLGCDELCSYDFGNGSAGSLSLGGTLNERWLIGADMVGWFPWSGADEGYNGDTDGFGAVLFTARHYPRVERGFFLTGGLGIGGIDLQDDDLQATGYVVKVGAGYDLRVGRTFSFTPSLSLVQTFSTEARVADDTVDGTVNFGMAVLGVAVTWH